MGLATFAERSYKRWHWRTCKGLWEWMAALSLSSKPILHFCCVVLWFSPPCLVKRYLLPHKLPWVWSWDLCEHLSHLSSCCELVLKPDLALMWQAPLLGESFSPVQSWLQFVSWLIKEDGDGTSWLIVCRYGLLCIFLFFSHFEGQKLWAKSKERSCIKNDLCLPPWKTKVQLLGFSLQELHVQVTSFNLVDSPVNVSSSLYQLHGMMLCVLLFIRDSLFLHHCKDREVSCGIWGLGWKCSYLETKHWWSFGLDNFMYLSSLAVLWMFLVQGITEVD